MDIIEFVEARIDQDEAHAEQAPDPTRALAECAAKWAIMALHMSTTPYCVDESACPTLRGLALPYAAHPDYLEAWRP